MPWKFESDRPIYAQILEQIKERIIVGEYPPGSRLPSVRELATEAAVNPNTMQRAMAELEREGYVVTNRTTGRTVTDNVGVIMEAKKSTAIELTQKYIEKMEQLGFSRRADCGNYKGGEIMNAIFECKDLTEKIWNFYSSR